MPAPQKQNACLPTYPVPRQDFLVSLGLQSFHFSIIKSINWCPGTELLKHFSKEMPEMSVCISMKLIHKYLQYLNNKIPCNNTRIYFMFYTVSYVAIIEMANAY